MSSTLLTNAMIHTGRTEQEVFGAMRVENGRIAALYDERFPSAPADRTLDLQGQHVYPCLIDPHVHLLLTVAVMAKGFSLCRITPEGVQPSTLAGVEERLRSYAAAQKPNAIIACSNYILTAMDCRRMPTRQELDDWCGGRPTVIYNIDGHSTSLSTAMMRLLGMDPEGHSGVLQGEENERAQGRIISRVGQSITPADLAKGVAEFQNSCAAYGISVVGALEGNGDDPKDPTTALIVQLARHFEVGVRLYPQYTDLKRVLKLRRYMKQPRVGGCGDWEMDGAAGSHSAAFYEPYLDTGTAAPCYYSQPFVDDLVRRAEAAGYQTASHAIGDAAIERILHAYECNPTRHLRRIEHCEFMNDSSFRRIAAGNYALVMQPGYAWIDQRYLHTYDQYLSPAVRGRMKLRSLLQAGVCVSGSSDSPVQDLDPWLQMLGMTQFYNSSESITPFQAFQCYTLQAARALEEEAERGTLEVGKAADFFTAGCDLFALAPQDIVSFRPSSTWYGGREYQKKKGAVAELAAMMLRPAKKI